MANFGTSDLRFLSWSWKWVDNALTMLNLFSKMELREGRPDKPVEVINFAGLIC